MKVLVILGHQNPGSFCHAIADTAVQTLEAGGHEVIYHDLYAEGFDPVLRHEQILRDSPQDPVIQRHCDEVRAAGGYVVVHPNWWAQPPAILKGWIDRVLRQGVAYEFGPGGAVIEHLAGKRAVVFTTSNTPRDAELALFGDPLENLWKACIFGFCGVKDFRRRNFEAIVMSTPQDRCQWLAEVRDMTLTHFPADQESRRGVTR
jgi:putative NADPH-quinone reductase